jgi:mono/diheme cytochrome c family protein
MRIALVIAALVCLAGCNDMVTQKRDKPYGQTSLFPNGAVAQHPPEGTIAQDDPAAQKALAERPAMSLGLLKRGKERFGIFCSPCHDFAGTGHGTVVARGFPQPPSLHEPRLRAAPSRYFVDVISHGHGVMYSYADRVSPADRWAIAAYIRALQFSQHAKVADLPAADRQKLEAAHAP